MTTAVEGAMSEGRMVAVEGGGWDDAAAADVEAGVSRRRELLLAVLASALLILVGVGGLYFVDVLDQREATVQALDRRVSDLVAANAALAKEVEDLGAERVQLLEIRESLTRDRDGLVSERTSLVADRARMTEEISTLTSARDRLGSERDRLNARLGDLDRQLIELRRQYDESDRALAAEKLESARQAERAKTAEAASLLYGQVVKLDNDINREYGVFLNWFSQLGDAYVNNDPLGFDTAYRRCTESAGRIESLLKQRERLASQLPR